MIEKLPPLICVKGVRSLLRYVRFYMHCIKDFSKIAHPIFKLLESNVKFDFDKAYLRAFEFLKEKLICAPVITSPN